MILKRGADAPLKYPISAEGKPFIKALPLLDTCHINGELRRGEAPLI